MFRRSDYNLDTYKIMISQVSHDHTRSNDNFLILLAINNSLLATTSLLSSHFWSWYKGRSAIAHAGRARFCGTTEGEISGRHLRLLLYGV